MRVPRASVLLLTSFLCICAGAAAAQSLLPHRAVYDLALAEADEEAQIEALSGRWVFEFSGSACEGYTLKSRIVMRFEMTEGSRLVDQRVTSFEDAAGETFRFVTKSLIDQELDSEVKGTARREGSGTVVEYEQPEKTERSFAPVLFPTGQLRELLEKAEAGERFYESAIFDGTEFTDDAVTVSVVVGRPKPVDEDDAEREALGRLAGDTFLPVTAAYFDGEAADGEEVSEYNVSFKLHESGIQRDMMIRYADYSMTAKLADLALFEPGEGCARESGN
ncbi:cell envelope integrity EipB family protein [Chelativorans salis]|uniref:Cell envelope integrity EipB family protein n=1 Tax=Chelativorans salis TaxID=2978478 RepID=A0ABT2LQJ7_9HYPH|nr:cell envelope integrity EipB family protein [Chelativorans sp. EGI FJ00035]MCT7375648.1 cell envelope integrity EipB family protein [Chelativorans sp. EGI FJ00035]